MQKIRRLATCILLITLLKTAYRKTLVLAGDWTAQRKNLVLAGDTPHHVLDCETVHS